MKMSKFVRLPYKIKKFYYASEGAFAFPLAFSF